MEKELNINGETYILKKEQKKKNDGIMDSANVLMFVECPDHESGDIIRFDKPNLVFKQSFSEDDTKEAFMSYDGEIVITPNKTKITLEAVEMSRKVLSLFNSWKIKKGISLVWFEGWDEKEKKFMKDYPVFITDFTRGFIIAPRVDQE